MTDQPPPAVGKTHDYDDRGRCRTCGTTRGESLIVGAGCVFVNTAPPPPKLIGADPADKPDGVVLYEKSEGVSIPDPGDVLQWAVAGAKL
jgi:hypothetical protein